MRKLRDALHSRTASLQAQNRRPNSMAAPPRNLPACGTKPIKCRLQARSRASRSPTSSTSPPGCSSASKQPLRLKAGATGRSTELFSPSLFAWYSNRPRPDLWIKALEALPADYFPRDGKETVRKAFSNPSHEHRCPLAVVVAPPSRLVLCAANFGHDIQRAQTPACG